MKRLFAVAIVVFAGCVGSPVHMTVRYQEIQRTIRKNNELLLKLHIGMTSDQVRSTLGDPERSEGYEWGSAWLYRTAMTSGIYGTADSDFTPTVFGKDGQLIGWGRNFFQEQVKRYDIEIARK